MKKISLIILFFSVFSFSQTTPKYNSKYFIYKDDPQVGATGWKLAVIDENSKSAYQLPEYFLYSTQLEDQIVDGETEKAPSQNIVYDALELKQPKVIFANNITDLPSPSTTPVGTQYYIYQSGNLYFNNGTNWVGL